MVNSFKEIRCTVCGVKPHKNHGKWTKIKSINGLAYCVRCSEEHKRLSVHVFGIIHTSTMPAHIVVIAPKQKEEKCSQNR